MKTKIALLSIVDWDFLIDFLTDELNQYNLNPSEENLDNVKGVVKMMSLKIIIDFKGPNQVMNDFDEFSNIQNIINSN